MSQGLLNSRRTKEELRKKALFGGEWQQYKKYRNTYNKLIKAAKLSTLNDQIKFNSGNSRKIWKLVNENIHKSNTKGGSPEKIKIDNSEITDTKDMACHFNDFFTNIGPRLANKIQTDIDFKKYLGPAKATKLNFEEVTQTEIRKIIMKNYS